MLSLFSPKLAAANNAPYDWGFNRYGIPKEILDDSEFENPFDSAEKAGLILDVTGDKYVSKAKSCFGVDIEKGGNGWEVVAKEDVNPSDSDYIDAGCNDLDDANWKRIIVFVFDSRLMDAVGCLYFDDASCSNIGVSVSSEDAQSSGGNPATSPANGNAQQLAQQLLDNPNVTYPYTDTTGITVEDVLKNIVETGKGIVNSPDVSFTSVDVSTDLLKALVEYADGHPIGLNCLTNCDHSSTSNHYKGIAIDIGCSPGLDVSAFDSIASKYGGANNGEVCPGNAHYHYDF